MQDDQKLSPDLTTTPAEVLDFTARADDSQNIPHDKIWPWLVAFGFVMLVVGVILSIILFYKPKNIQTVNPKSIKGQAVNTGNLAPIVANFQQINGDSLTVNAQLQTTQGIVIKPQTLPAAPSLGQLYIDNKTNTLRYFNGKTFVTVASTDELNALKVTTTIQGGLSAAQILALINANKVTLPQDLSKSATPTFSDVKLSGLTTNGLVIAGSGGKLQTVTASGAGQCLVSTAGAPQFSACSASTGVSSVNGLLGSLTLQQTANQVLISSNGINTLTFSLPQSIGTGSTPSFAGLNLTVNPLGVLSGGTGANNAAGARSNLGAAASGANSDITSLSGLTTPLAAFEGGTGVDGSAAANGQLLIGNGAGFTLANLVQGSGIIVSNGAGSISIASTLGNSVDLTSEVNGILPIANGGTNSNNAIGARTNLGAAASGANSDITSTSALDTIIPDNAFTLGAANQTFTLQGNASSTITANGGGAVTTVGFSGVPTGDVTYYFDRTASTGVYDICTTAGNCSTNGVTTVGGTAGTIPVFTSSQAIADSILTQSGGVITVGGSAVIQGSNGLTIGQAGSANGQLVLYNSMNGNALILQSGATASNNLTFTLPSSDGLSGQCLKTDGAGVFSFGNCVAAVGGVTSITGASGGGALTGALIVNNTSGSGATLTIDDASTAQKGIAQFNSTNFTGVGTINTVQDIATTSSPSFAGLNVTTTTGLTLGTGVNQGKLFVRDGATAFTDTLQSTTLSGNHVINIPDAGGTIAVSGSGYINVDSTTGDITFVGPLQVADGGTGATDAAGARTSLQAAQSGANNDIISTSALNTITPSGTLTIGSSGNQIILQGDETSVVKATGSIDGFVTAIGFTGTATGNVTYQFDRTATPGTYDICTKAGNCTGLGGGVTTTGGTTGTIPVFTSSQAIGDSILSQSGGVLNVGGAEVVQGSGGLGLGVASTTNGKVVFYNSSNANSLTLQSGTTGSNLTLTLPTADGGTGDCLKTDGSGNLSFGVCLSGGGAGGGVTFLNGLSGSLTVAGTANQVNVSTGGATITLSTPQDINTTSAPSFAGLSVTGSNGITVGTGGTTGKLVVRDGSSAFSSTIQPTTLNANRTITLPDASGTVAVSASGNINLSATGQITFTGVLPIANGGTAGNAAPTAGAVAYGTGSAYAFTSAGSSNQVLISGGAGAPSFSNIASLLTAGSNIALSGTTNATIATIANPTFGTSVTTPILQSSGSLTIGSTGQNFTLRGDATSTITATDSGNTTTVGFTTPTANRSILFPDAAGTVCLTSGNCLGGGSGGANVSLSNLSSVAINTSLLPGTAGTINLGSSSKPFEDLYLAGTSGTPGTNNFRFTGVASAARTITIPDNSGTLAVTASGYINLDSAGNITFVGPLGVPDGGTGANNAAGARTNLSAAESGTNGDINTTTALNTITPNGALTIGDTSQQFTLQGNTSSTVKSSDGTNVTTVGFTGVATGNVTYNFDRSAAPGTYTICTTVGNCTGGGVTGSGTTGTIPVFTSSNAIGDSILTQSGGIITVGGDAVVQGSNGLGLGVASTTNGQVVFYNNTNGNKLTLQSGTTGSNLTLTLPTADGGSGDCLHTNGSGVLTFSACVTGGSGGVSDINSLSGSLTLAGTTNQINVASGGATITLSTPQDINTTSAPSFAGLSVTTTTGLTLGTGSAQGKLIVRDGSSAFKSTIQSTTLTADRVITIPDAGGTLAVSAAGNINLSAAGQITFTGTLPINNGGTNGTATPTAGTVAYGTGTAYGFTSAGSSNQVLISNGSSAPSFANISSLLTAGTNIALSGTTNVTVATIANPNFATSVTTPILQSTGTMSITPGGALTVGSTGQSFTLQGNASSAITATNLGNTTTVGFTTPTANRSILFPDAAGTVCLTSGNCLGGGSGGANVSLSNLSSVAINTSLLPGSAGTINLGSSSLPFEDLYLAGTSGTPGTNNFHFTGVATSPQTITIPDASGTICLQTSSACGFATGSGNAFVQGGNTFGATGNLGTNDANDLNIRTNGSTRLTVKSGGDLAVDTSTLYVDATNHFVGVGTSTPGNLFSVGTLNTAAASAQAAITTNGINNIGLVVQAASIGQIANLQEWQGPTGTVVAEIGNGGAIRTASGTTNSFGSIFGTASTIVNVATTGNPSFVGLNIQGASSQTGDYLRLTDSSNAMQAHFNNSGALALGNQNGNAVQGRLTVYTASAGTVGEVIQGAASQTADLFQILDSSNNNLVHVNSAGNFVVGSANQFQVTNSHITTAIAATIDNSQSNTAPSLKVTNSLGTTISSIIQGASGQSVDILEIQDNNGLVNSAFSSGGNQLTLGRIAASGTVTQGKLVFSDGTTDNRGLTMQTAVLGQNTTVTLPDPGAGTATVCYQFSAAACGYAASSGSGNYIQNQNAAQQSATFWISGNARVDGNVLTNTVDTAAAGTLNLGTATATTTNLGNSSGSATTNVQGGTGGINIGTANSANTIQIGNTANGIAQTINIGNNATVGSSTAVVIGNTVAGNITLQSAATINIGQNPKAQTITIGNTAGATSLTLKVGTGNFSLDGVAGSTYSLGSSTTTGSITIGGGLQNGTITLGQSTASNTINIGSAVGATNTQTINIGTSATASSTTNVNIGSTVAGSIALQSAGGVSINTLGSANTATYLCRNGSNQIATCNSTGNGVAYIQGGNSFGATGELGTNDNNNLNIRTNNIDRLTIDTTGNLQFATLNGGTHTLNTAASSTVNAAGDNITVSAGNANGSTTGNTGGNLSLNGGNAAGTGNNNGGSVTINGGSATGSGAGGGINIGTSAVANTIQIGNITSGIAQSINIGNNATASSTDTIQIGNLLTTSSTLIQGGTGGSAVTIQSAGTINIGQNAVAQTLNIGNTTGATGIVERVGTGNYSLDGVGGSTYTLGSSTVAGTITIGGTAETGTITLGRSTASNTISIGGAIGNAATQTINIGNSSTGGSTTNVTIGSTIGTSGINLQAGTGNATITTPNQTFTFSGCGGTCGQLVAQGALLLTSGAATQITVDSSTTGSVNVGTGSNSKTVTIGNTTGTTGLNLQAGSGGISVTGLVTSSSPAALCLSGGKISACDSSNTTGSAFLQGGNSFGAAGNLGTNDANALNIRTGGSTRLSISSGGLFTMTGGTLTAGQTSYAQTLTNGSSTGGTVTGISQTLTVNNTSSGSTSIGQGLTVTDNTALSNTNYGLQVTLNGSNSNQVQYGIDVTANRGTGIRSTISGTSGISCGGTVGTMSIAVCADNIDTSASIGLYARSSGYNNASSLLNTVTGYYGTGVLGANTANPTTNNAVVGVKGMSVTTATQGTVVGVSGIAKASSGATVYGGYYNIDGNSTATAGAALYATTQQPGSVSGNGQSAVYVLQAVGGTGGNTSGTTGQTAGNGAGILLQGGNGGTAGSGSTNGNGGTITLSAGAAGAGAGTAGSAGSVIIKNAGDSSTAFQLQDSTGVALITAGSIATSNMITNGNFELNVTGWSAKGGASSPVQSSAHAYLGSNSLAVTTTTSANSGGQVTSFTSSLTNGLSYYFTFYARSSATFSNFRVGHIDGGSDVDCTFGIGVQAADSTISSNGWTQYSCTFTANNTTALYFKQSDSGTTRTIYIDNASMQQSGTGTHDADEGTINLNASITSPLLIQPNEDSTTALHVMASNGYNIFNVDTLNQQVAVSSSMGTALQSISSAGNGIFGVTSSSSSAGVDGLALGTGYGVYGQSTAGVSGYFQNFDYTNTSATLVARAGNSGSQTSNLFEAQNNSGAMLFGVSSSGDLIFSTDTSPSTAHSISVATQTTSNTAGKNLSVSAGMGNGTGAGGNLSLNGGQGGATNAMGGAVTVQGGLGGGLTGTGGSVIVIGGTGGGPNFGAAGSGGEVDIFGGAAGSGNANSGGNVVISGGAKTSGSSGSVIIKPQSGNDTTTAFQIQNASSTPILTADTTNSQLFVRGTNSTASIGSELASGTSCSGTNWSGTGPWTHTTGSTTALTCTVPASTTAGATYQVTFTISNDTQTGNVDTVSPSLGGTLGGYVGANITYTMIITTTNTNGLTFVPQSNFDGKINTISVKLVTTSNSVLSVQNSNGNSSAALEVRSGGAGLFNSFVGTSAGFANTTGNDNSALGYFALQANTTGADNTAMGYTALGINTTGINNSAFGSQALGSNITGNYNTAVGHQAAQNTVSGSANTAIGEEALLFNTIGSNNTAVGMKALDLNYSGSNNTSIGYDAGRQTSNIATSNGTYVGYEAGGTDPTVSSFVSQLIGGTLQNASAFGYGSQVQASNSLILGGQGANAVNVGIGTTIPLNTFSVMPMQYNAGTICQGSTSACNSNGTTIFGSSTTFTTSMVGSQIVFADGTSDTITAFTSGTQVTVSGSRTHASSAYRIHYIGFQVKSDGTVYTQGNSATQMRVLDGSNNVILSVSANNYAGGANAANTILTVAKDSGTGRSINAAGTVNASGLDYAEYFVQHVPGELHEGQLVCLLSDRTVEPCTTGGNLIGSISINPGYVGNDIYDPVHPENTALVGLLGQIPVNVSDANGAIQPGDPLTLSDQSGVAVKATGGGKIVGTAMESLSSGSGTIMVLVSPGYYNPLDNMQGDVTLNNLMVNGTLHVDTLVVTGPVSVGTLTVNGHIITAGNTPTIAAQAAACTSPTVDITGNDTSGSITITTGSGCSASGALAKVSFANAYGAAPKMVISPTNSAATDLKYFVGSSTTTDFTINTSTVPADATTYTYNFFGVQ